MIAFSKAVILALAVGLGAPAAMAKELSAEELRALQSQMKASDFLTVDFVQTSYTALRGKSRQRQGQAQFAKPNRFRWMLETPVKEYKLFNGSEFFDYSPEEKSAVRYKAGGQNVRELRQIVDLVMNFDSLLTRYELVKATEEDGLVRVELKPKTKSDVVTAEVHFALKEGYISFIRFNLQNKNHLTHEFSKARREAIAADRFEIPQGVKVTSMN